MRAAAANVAASMAACAAASLAYFRVFHWQTVRRRFSPTSFSSRTPSHTPWSRPDVVRYRGKLYFSEGAEARPPEPQPLPGSCVAFSLNGVPQVRRAGRGLLMLATASVPLQNWALQRRARGARHGRGVDPRRTEPPRPFTSEHPDIYPLQGKAYEGVHEGTYYPALSLYTHRGEQGDEAAVATVNFGEQGFAFPPPQLEGLPPPRPACEMSGPRPMPPPPLPAAAAVQGQPPQQQEQAVDAAQPGPAAEQPQEPQEQQQGKEPEGAPAAAAGGAQGGADAAQAMDTT